MAEVDIVDSDCHPKATAWDHGVGLAFAGNHPWVRTQSFLGMLKSRHLPHSLLL